MTRGDARRPWWRIRITMTVVTLFTTLSVLGIGTVLAIGIIGASENTEALVHERTATALSEMLGRVRQQLAPIRQAMADVASDITDGSLDLDD